MSKHRNPRPKVSKPPAPDNLAASPKDAPPRYATRAEQIQELYDHNQKRDLLVADALAEIAHQIAASRGTGAVGAIAAVVDFMVRQYAPRRRRWS